MIQIYLFDTAPDRNDNGIIDKHSNETNVKKQPKAEQVLAMKIKNIEICKISELLQHGNANRSESCRWVDDTSEKYYCWQSPQVSISFSHFFRQELGFARCKN